MRTLYLLLCFLYLTLPLIHDDDFGIWWPQALMCIVIHDDDLNFRSYILIPSFIWAVLQHRILLCFTSSEAATQSFFRVCPCQKPRWVRYVQWAADKLNATVPGDLKITVPIMGPRSWVRTCLEYMDYGTIIIKDVHTFSHWHSSMG